MNRRASRAPVARLVFAAVVLVLALAGFVRLRFQADVLGLLPADLPTVAGLRLHQEHFANAQELVVTVRAPDADAALAAVTNLSAGLRARADVGAVVAAPPWREADATAELLALAWLNQPPPEFDAMLARLSPVAASNALLRARERLATTFSAEEIARLSYDPLELTRVFGDGGAQFGGVDSLFASAEGTFRVMFVRPREKLSGYLAVRDWLAGVRGTISEVEHSNGWNGRIRLTGGPAFQSEISSGMERDLHRSAIGTLLIVGALIWLMHRRVGPVLRIVALLVAVLAATLAAAGLVIGELNLISVGFAAILLGLAADYGLVLYHESFGAEGNRSAVRRRVGSGIVWSAVTTAGAFALLAMAGLPGLAQLGALVAIGILIAAAVMLRWFPMAAAIAGTATLQSAMHGGSTGGPPSAQAGFAPSHLSFASALAATALLVWVIVSPPKLDWTSGPLRPTGSESYAAMEEMQSELGQRSDSLWLVVPGADESEVHNRLSRLEANLRAVQEGGGGAVRVEWQLPGALWPNPPAQRQNVSTALLGLDSFDETIQTARSLGFEDTALALTRRVVERLRAASLRSEPVLWPSVESARWMTDQFAARFPGGAVAVGLATVSGSADADEMARVRTAAADAGAILSGWSLLGPDLMRTVLGRLARLLAAVGGVMIAALWLAFRRVGEVLLSAGAVAFGVLLLLGVMSVVGWEWNLMNLLALPLMLGVGIDYGIHMQLALRRASTRSEAMRGVGRALILCAATTVVGFGSLGFSSNAGLASLGRVCAAGVACMAVAAIGLLPAWWGAWFGNAPQTPPQAPNNNTPPRIYRAFFWRCGLAVARVLPRRVLQWLCVLGARGFRLWNPGRVETVLANLLPVLDGDRAAAESAALRMFDEFGLKLADLWRAEAGLDIAPLVIAEAGWEALDAAQATGRGLLLVTPHLGNWEFGAPLILRRGLTLNVLTLAEPGASFTELRDSARRRGGVRTHVVGGDPFAFVEIIKRLQSGEAVALLMDRPPPASAVRVELFGKPFDASIAVAELARASGAAILPVTVCRTGGDYAVRLLDEVKYDRAALGSREARIALTGEILRAFEPAIRQHPEQWFHFVPIWPRLPR